MKILSTLFPGAAALSLTLSSVCAVDLIPWNATWDYMNPTDGVDPAIADTNFDTTWMGAGTAFLFFYDGPAFGANPALVGPPVDSGSGPAPFGYGGTVTYIENELGGVATTLTTPATGFRYTSYFRHTFSVGTAVANAALEIMADDGAAIYLDGALIETVNLGNGNTFTDAADSSTNEGFSTIIIGGIGALSAGDHTLAVSVHQGGTTSSDMGFALRLSDDGPLSPIIGATNLNGVTGDFAVDGAIGEWEQTGAAAFGLNNGDGGIVRSEPVSLAGLGEVLFSMNILLDETSVSSNFEDTDSFNAFLELDDGAGGITTLPLIPAALDSDASGALTGDEFGPGVDAGESVVLSLFLTARIPAGISTATLVIEAINNSNSEFFELSNALFTDAIPGGLNLGTVEITLPMDIPLLVGPDLWVQDSPRVFSINDIDVPSRLVSDSFGLGGVSQAEVSLLLSANETSSVSNFEGSDTFQAWVETITASGNTATVQLVSGALDADADNILQGDEIAPGADDADNLMEQIAFSARLPVGAVQARIFIEAVNNSASETFIVSDLFVREAPPLPDAFAITDIMLVPGTGVQLSWETEVGAGYELQFSPDLAEGNWTTVETLMATGAITTTTHDPAGASQAFYRAARVIIAVP